VPDQLTWLEIKIFQGIKRAKAAKGKFRNQGESNWLNRLVIMVL